MALKITSALKARLPLIASGLFICSLFLLNSDGRMQVAQQTDMAAIRKRITTIISERLKEGVFIRNGTITYTRVPPSPNVVNEIKGYGDNALPILSDYLKSNNERERAIAVEFTGLLGGGRIVAPLQRVIKYDTSPHVRVLALRWITQAPSNMAAPIIREAANRDTDEKVRSVAKDILESKSFQH